MTQDKSTDIFGPRAMGVFNSDLGGVKALVRIESDIGSDTLEVVALHMAGQVSESYQAMKSFTDDVYITLFGQALNMYKVTCRTMTQEELCPDLKASGKSEIKLLDLKTLYNTYRIGADARPVIRITMDTMSIHGVLVAMPLSTANVAGSNCINFELSILGQMIL